MLHDSRKSSRHFVLLHRNHRKGRCTLRFLRICIDERAQHTLSRRNSYRNPVIAEALKAMGYVNKFGYGIQRTEALLRDNGNPPAEFEIDDKVFGVTVRRNKA